MAGGVLPRRIMAEFQKAPEGTPLTAKDLLHLGNRDAVDQALSRLARRGSVTRLGRGAYMAASAVAGEPNLTHLVEAFTEHRGEVIATSAQEAARRLGMTGATQIEPVFLTSGANRHLVMAGQTVQLHHAPTWQLVLPESAAGDVVRVLAWLGPVEAIGAWAVLKNRIKPVDREELIGLRGRIPTWIADLVSDLAEGAVAKPRRLPPAVTTPKAPAGRPVAAAPARPAVRAQPPSPPVRPVEMEIAGLQATHPAEPPAHLVPVTEKAGPPAEVAAPQRLEPSEGSKPEAIRPSPEGRKLWTRLRLLWGRRDASPAAKERRRRRRRVRRLGYLLFVVLSVGTIIGQGAQSPPPVPIEPTPIPQITPTTLVGTFAGGGICPVKAASDGVCSVVLRLQGRCRVIASWQGQGTIALKLTDSRGRDVTSQVTGENGTAELDTPPLAPGSYRLLVVGIRPGKLPAGFTVTVAAG